VNKRLQRNEQQAVSSFLDRLQHQLRDRVQQVVLFGSKARGDSRSWSDIDVLIVVDREDWRLSHAISDLAADVSLECDVLLGPRVIGRERWERTKQRGYGLYQSVAAEGILLMQ